MEEPTRKGGYSGKKMTVTGFREGPMGIEKRGSLESSDWMGYAQR